ncbi:MAG: MBOAT family protein, partial [Alphaproteobacteria bacterium]|nr:MBOAT family protein [Alphaproteobacteria bacterium]
MVFSSLVFLWLFLPIVIGTYFLAQEKYRNLLLLIASLFFYAWGEPIYVLVMIFSIVINYVCGQLIGGESAKNK